MTSRIHRGFHRIGVVLAAPALALGVGIACQQTWLGWNSHEIIPRADGSLSYEDAISPAPAYYGYALAWAALGIVLYAAARAVGWVLDGFMSPEA